VANYLRAQVANQGATAAGGIDGRVPA
jgi:hypothetical protein